MEMNHVFANRVRVCFFRLLFLLVGVSLTPLAFAQLDPGDTYCSNFTNNSWDVDFYIKATISLNSYNSGWQPQAYTYTNTNSYQCELIFKYKDVCAIYEDTGTVECDLTYTLTGRKFRGFNPSPGGNFTSDSSLNPSNRYMNQDGTFHRGMNCTEGQHVYTPFPRGYRYVPFDGFKYLSSDAWQPCLSDVAYGHFSGIVDYYFDSLLIRDFWWDSEYFSSNKNTCVSLIQDCLSVTILVYSFDEDGQIGHFPYKFYESFYARCPPYSQFSPVHGACYVVEADELLAGTGIGDADLYAQPGGGDKVHVNFNSVNLLSQLSKPDINQCPAPLTTTFKGQTITFFDYTDSCQMLGDYVKPFVLLLGSFISIAILLGISTTSISANEG